MNPSGPRNSPARHVTYCTNIRVLIHPVLIAPRTPSFPLSLGIRLNLLQCLRIHGRRTKYPRRTVWARDWDAESPMFSCSPKTRSVVVDDDRTGCVRTAEWFMDFPVLEEANKTRACLEIEGWMTYDSFYM